MNYTKFLVVSVVSVINFLSHGMERLPTKKAKKTANIRLLHAAVTGNSEGITRLLMDGIADINAHNLNQSTPLQCACVNNHTIAALTLIQTGADVDNVDRYGETALVCAVKHKNIELVKALINAQANINIYVSDKISLLRLAFISNDIEIIKILLDNGSTQKERTLLFAATTYDTSCLCYQCSTRNRMYLKVARLLIESGANVNARTKNKYHTPLILACFANNTDVALALLEAGAHVNDKDKTGDTAFKGAVKNKNVILIHALIKAGADINVYDIWGVTALIAAIESQQFDVIIAILNPIAKLQARKKIETLLMIYDLNISLVSSLPKDVLKLIITFAHPEFAMDAQLLGEIDSLDLIDTIPLEILGMLITHNILNQGSIINAWHEKILFLGQTIEAQKYLSSNAIQAFEADVLTHILMALTQG